MENFPPIWSHVNENEKKKIRKKINKILKNNNENCLEIWWTDTFPQNLALMVSEKNGFYTRTDGRTTDSCLKTVALLCSSTKRIKNIT